jgi:plasmid maintenance system antidote protein VapI
VRRMDRHPRKPRLLEIEDASARELVEERHPITKSPACRLTRLLWPGSVR